MNRKLHQQTLQGRIAELESELKQTKCENVKLEQSLDQARKHSSEQSEKISELKISEIRANDAVTELQKQLHETNELLSTTKEELNETRQRLSDVQERLTVEQEYTNFLLRNLHSNELQASGNSEHLRREVTPQHQPTTRPGLLAHVYTYTHIPAL